MKEESRKRHWLKYKDRMPMMMMMKKKKKKKKKKEEEEKKKKKKKKEEEEEKKKKKKKKENINEEDPIGRRSIRSHGPCGQVSRHKTSK
jgi:flagellar biosynthesis component FlhA